MKKYSRPRIVYFCALAQTLARLMMVISLLTILFVFIIKKTGLIGIDLNELWILVIIWLPFVLIASVLAFLIKCDVCSKYALIVKNHYKEEKYKNKRKIKKWEDFMNWREIKHREMMCVHCYTLFRI